ncbi:MAG: RecX family transcriptional regulator [Eubacterium sp.]|nr:RecX family transcriptional regulator [Eubacterium sp.]
MAEVNIEKKGSRNFVIIDGEKIGFLYDSDIRRLGLIDGQELDEAAVEELRDILYRRTYNKACSYLETAEYCGAEIRFKLKHNDFADDMIERVIAELYEKKYLDDRRYAEAYIRSYSATKGRKLIETELAYKKIDRELIREAYEEYLEESEYDEDKVIEDMIRKKYGSADLSDIKVKSKIISYFSRKGFNLDKVNNHLT